MAARQYNAIARQLITNQKREHAVRRTPLKSHFCLLFGAQQKVRRLPGRNPAVLIFAVGFRSYA